MECKDLLDRLSDYVDDDLADELCQEIEHHMQACDNCRIMVDTLNKTVLLFRRHPSPSVPTDVETRLYKVLALSDYAKPK